MVDSKRIGERLRKLRGEQSQAELGRAIGVTPQAICYYENGLRIPSDVIKCKIAEHFGRTVQEIFYD